MATDPRFDGQGPDQAVLAALARGELLIARCTACAACQPGMRMVCAACGGTALARVPAAGGATVYSATTVRRRPEQGGDYNVSIIELDEGVRLMSRVEGIAADAVRIGMRVTARVAGSGEDAVLVFDPAGGEG